MGEGIGSVSEQRGDRVYDGDEGAEADRDVPECFAESHEQRLRLPLAPRKGISTHLLVVCILDWDTFGLHFHIC